MNGNRVIMHLDMDAFFAAIEQRDNPEYRGKPVVVGADPQGGVGRGVVSTCSYEARPYGIHSAQPINEAYRRCPDAIFLPVRMHAYEHESKQIRAILRDFTPDIEPISIDEAFLDVTGCLRLFGGKRELARRMQHRIEDERNLTASVGVAPNKLVAKIASDMDKPEGFVVVEPDEVDSFLRPLAVGRLWGVGEKTEASLTSLGIKTVGDLADFDRRELARRFGKHGEQMWALAHGSDERPVKPRGEAKSVGREHTFKEDTGDAELIGATLMRLCEDVARRLRKAGQRGVTVTTKIRFEDFSTFTRATTLEGPVDDAVDINSAACANLDRVKLKGRKVRLIGVSVSGLQRPDLRQKSLFAQADEGAASEEKKKALGQAIDKIKDRFGEDALQRGASFRPADGKKGQESR